MRLKNEESFEEESIKIIVKRVSDILDEARVVASLLLLEIEENK